MRTLALVGALGIAGMAAPALVAQPSRDRAAFDEEAARLERERPDQYTEVREEFTLFAEMLLGRLGYDVGPFDGVLDGRTRAAVRQYQTDRRIPETGDPFSFDTILAVRMDDDLMNTAAIRLQGKHIILDRWDRGFVSADGTWTVVGEDMASPEQTSNITCDLTDALCREARATISGTGLDRRLTVDLFTFEIERWNEREIVTKPLQFGCTGTAHRWDRTGQSVTGVRSTTSSEGSCRTAERIERRLVLEDGNEVSRRLDEKQREAWLRIVRVSPAILQKLTAPN
jgi:hypothetical protein